jgi:hypothetical protein
MLQHCFHQIAKLTPESAIKRNYMTLNWFWKHKSNVMMVSRLF